MAAGTETKITLTPYEELKMEIESFAVYNENREAFSSLMQRSSSLLGIISGTALVAMARSDYPTVSLLFGFITSILSGANLVFDFSGLSRRHRELRINLMNILDGMNERNSMEEIEIIRKKYSLTYSDSPLIFYAASAASFNAIQMRYRRSTILNIPWYARVFRNFWRFSPDSFTEYVSVS